MLKQAEPKSAGFLLSKFPICKPEQTTVRSGEARQSSQADGDYYFSYRDRPHMQRYTIIWTLVVVALAIGILAQAEAKEGLVAIAQKEIGCGETKGNNNGPDIKRYMQGREGLPWCAGFVSYCLKKDGQPYPYMLRARDFLKIGKRTDKPEPGDLMVLSRGRDAGHIGIVEKVEGDRITTIEGNIGKYPSLVKRVTYRGSPRNLLGYTRIGGR